ncbi:MAG: dihydroneopterin aldolase [Muribaculaceae bacterium]
MNSIYIKNLEVYAFHGVLPQENVVGNTFFVTVRLDCDLSRAMETDSVEYSVNYAEVVEIIKGQMAVTSKTLENVVFRIREALQQHFPQVCSGMVKVAKQSPPIPGAKAEEVAVSVEF